MNLDNKNRIWNIAEKILVIIEGRIDNDLKVADLKNYISLLTNILDITKKIDLNCKRIDKVDHKIICDFIDRYIGKHGYNKKSMRRKYWKGRV
ncbi:MAG: hypothetical protein AAFO15_02275 [Pseudomonadota bacterium]